MSGQWEQYVPAAARAIRETPRKRTIFWEDENGIPVDEGDPRAVNRDYLSSEDYDAEARAVIAVVGPLIAEDTRERMVEAAAAVVERDGLASLYYCPAGDEIEQHPGGGFDICCDRLSEHQPITPQALAAARREVSEEIAKAIERCVADLGQWPGEFYQEAAAKAREIGAGGSS